MAKKKTIYTASDGKMVITLEVAEEGGYIVTSPLDPGILTQAESLEEAFENAYDVVEGLKEARAKLQTIVPSASGSVIGRSRKVRKKAAAH